MIIKVLGVGCPNCRTLEQRTAEAVKRMHLPATIEKITDLQQIALYGVMRTPGLVVDEKVLTQGRIPTVDQIEELLTHHVA